MFKPVGSKVKFPQLEEEILRFWKKERIFERSVEERRDSPLFVTYEGPPTMNGMPGIHHVLARVFKDVVCRYRTMKGFCVPRKAGWDTHGLPVELEAEKKLGFNGKPQIEEYGIEKFNAICRVSVEQYLREWEEVTDRIGFWTDMGDPYITFDPKYIESCWWIIKQLWDKELVYLGYRVTPHCPRCGTSISSHEMALGYKENTEDPSVYIKFKLDPMQSKVKEVFGTDIADGKKPIYLMAWTTTPWTLPGNTALAVSAESEYSVLEGESDYIVFASELLGKVETEDYHLVRTVNGGALVGLEYYPLFNPHEYGVTRSRFNILRDNREGLPEGMLFPQSEEKDLRYAVIATNFVTMDEGTGIVHMAPAFGEVDFLAGKERGLDFVQSVDLEGKVIGKYAFSGLFVKDADSLIIEDLKSRELLFRSGKIRHTYPFCWRCNSPLLYYAKQTWYIRTTAKKNVLISGNEHINWYPEHIKRGRFGDWLEHNVDWAFSRERYWGTPLPIWQCESNSNHTECIGSVEELRNKSGLEGLKEPLDPHRPYVDRITFDCPQCGATMRRVPEVIDCWFDSGAMPVAQWHYPFENSEVFRPNKFPADYICEAVDQTRGWFYSLHAISSLLFEEPCFKNVICLGHILDSKGEKMSKSKGNVIEPYEILDNQGADALRWYLFTSSPAGNVRRFSSELVTEVMRKSLMTLWNTYSFFTTYADIDNFEPASAASGSETDLDRWVLSELNQLIVDVTQSMDGYKPTEAARRIAEFVDGLSNWYVRRSRRRFWKSESDDDKLAAYHTLYSCLVTLSRLLAPFTPFIAEEMYQNLVRSVDDSSPDSVHLTDYPVAVLNRIDKQLSADTQVVIKICSLGRAARSKASIKVRQPLARVLVGVKSLEDKESLRYLGSQVMEELNVKKIDFIENESEVVDFRIKPNLILLGPKYGKEMGAITRALKEMDPSEVVREVKAGEVLNLAGHAIS
ncbi:MAG: isoleucine--tRNA ligase, partial [Dehalococcoidia bacterium]|nr:isoleucine--tRNA ligase [Dehalococcoidia bacterium]